MTKLSEQNRRGRERERERAVFLQKKTKQNKPDLHFGKCILFLRDFLVNTVFELSLLWVTHWSFCTSLTLRLLSICAAAAAAVLMKNVRIYKYVARSAR